MPAPPTPAALTNPLNARVKGWYFGDTENPKDNRSVFTRMYFYGDGNLVMMYDGDENGPDSSNPGLYTINKADAGLVGVVTEHFHSQTGYDTINGQNQVVIPSGFILYGFNFDASGIAHTIELEDRTSGAKAKFTLDPLA